VTFGIIQSLVQRFGVRFGPRIQENVDALRISE